MQRTKQPGFETLVSDLLTLFLNIPDLRIDAEIKEALRRIAELLGLDQGLIVQWGDDATRPVPTHSWTIPGALPVERFPGNEVVPWVHSQSVLGNIVMFSRVDELPEEAEQDKEFFRRRGQKSLISLPLKIGGRVVGVLIFASLRAETAWPGDVVRRLQLLADVFAGVLERKRMQEHLRTAADGWTKTFNTIQDMIMIMDREFRIVQMNDAAVKFFGLPNEKLIGAECFRLMHGTERPIGGCPCKKMMDTKKHEETDVYDEMHRKWLHVVVDPLLDEMGEVIGVVHTVKDITDQKFAEMVRRESMERYRAVVEAYDGLIYICSQDYHIEFMNQRLIERTGRNAVGALCYRVLHDRDSVCPWCVNEQVFRGETVRWEVQSPKDHRWYYVVNTPIRHTDGTISKQSMIMDITERKSAEETLRQSEASLRSSQMDLRELAGKLISAKEDELRRLSRELHDDLTQRLAVLAIEAGKLELQLNKMPHFPPEPLQKISQVKEQLIKVSEDVHRISRQLHPTILDDLGLVRAIESECAALMRREDLEISFRKEDVPGMIANDIALCLYRVVQEGLRNVITHSRAKTCEIFLKGADNTLCLLLSDNGVGFDPVEVRHKPGLGLSSMRERAQLVRGDFSITSRPGQGAVIRICVPLKGGGA